MEKVMRMIVFGVLAVAVLTQVTTAQTHHIVGDNFGWSIPINCSATYTTWANANSIKVGDTLVFKFTDGNHSVQEVSKSSYEECNMKNAIGEAIKTGPANITVKTAGDHYYICTVGQHCLAGQKMAIKVSATNALNSPPVTAPPPSSSTVMFASFLLTFSSITLAIIF